MFLLSITVVLSFQINNKKSQHLMNEKPKTLGIFFCIDQVSSFTPSVTICYSVFIFNSSNSLPYFQGLLGLSSWFFFSEIPSYSYTPCPSCIICWLTSILYPTSKENKWEIPILFWSFLRWSLGIGSKNAKERFSPWNLLQNINFATDEQLISINTLQAICLILMSFWGGISTPKTRTLL